MSDMEREVPRPPRPRPGTPGTNDGDGLGAIRSSAERLADAAEVAIARALSGDSEQFLRETHQSTGE